MIRTKITERYGLELPFVGAGMGFISTPRLAAAVSNAGGLGQLACGAAPPESLRTLIDETRRLTARPFAVNFLVEATAFGPLTTEAHIDVAAEARTRAATFFWRRPPAEWVKKLKASGCDVWLQTSSLAEARAAVADGVDVIVAQGAEAGGHNRGTLGLFVLLPLMIDAVGGVPVVGAGGIADGRGMAAALCLGAEAVAVGTRLIATPEANAHDEYKRRILRAKPEDVGATCIFGPEWPDAPMRVLRNRIVREWGAHGKTPPSSEVIGRTVLAGRDYAMPKFSAVLPTPETTGDFEQMCLAAGDSAALIDSIMPAAEIARSMCAEAAQIIDRRAALMSKS